MVKVHYFVSYLLAFCSGVNFVSVFYNPFPLMSFFFGVMCLLLATRRFLIAKELEETTKTK